MTAGAVPRVFWDGDGYGLFWAESHFEGNRAFFKRLTAEGSRADDDVIIFPYSFDVPGFSIVWTGDEYGLTWLNGTIDEDGNGDDIELCFSLLSDTGERLIDDVGLGISDLNAPPSLASAGSEIVISILVGELEVHGGMQICERSSFR